MPTETEKLIARIATRWHLPETKINIVTVMNDPLEVLFKIGEDTYWTDFKHLATYQ